MSARDFYGFHLHQRDTERDTLLRGCRLFQEYMCMALAKVENMRLKFLASNQSAICADLYQNIVDAVAASDHDQISVKGSFCLLHSQAVCVTCTAATKMQWPQCGSTANLTTSLQSLAILHGLTSMKPCYPVRMPQIGQILWPGCSGGNSTSCYMKLWTTAFLEGH